MKPERKVATGARREERLRASRDDPYRENSKHEPATCPRCHAAYVKGRWTWGRAPADAVRETCPACRRIEDAFPAGYLTLKGPFFDQHRDEILGVVQARAGRAREEHPMQRLIGVERVAGGTLVTTTDAHLARGIGVALRDAFKGQLEIQFSPDENLVRATWSR
jgi:hypothetical protein